MTFELCAHSWPSFDIPQAPLEAVRRLSAQISHAPTDSPAGNSKPTRSQLEENAHGRSVRGGRRRGPRTPGERPPLPHASGAVIGTVAFNSIAIIIVTSGRRQRINHGVDAIISRSFPCAPWAG